MTGGAGQIQYRPLHAPREDRTALVEPPLDQVEALVAANQELRKGYAYDFSGYSLPTLAGQAREELVAAARRYTSAYRDVDVPPFEPGRNVFLAGHQPQLFHPGVWFKNFAMGALARQHAAVPVNLVIDSDAMKTAAIRVPGGTVARPHATLLTMDALGPMVPFEERRILDSDTFAGFGRRAAEEIASLVREPLVRQYWPLVRERARVTANLGECLAQSRHQMEGQWGLQTLELPQSHVCRLPAFAWFTACMLADLPRFAAAYNEAVDEYRQIYHIRSAGHPVPNLAEEDGWLEAPFWIWTADDPRRRRLFVRRDHQELALTDRQKVRIALPLAPGGGVQPAAQRLLELPGEGAQIRSRALVTTLWARLVLSDLFLHGIGGAKYDQVTDALIERLFGLRPPGILVLSATIQLPIPRPRVTAEDARAIDRRLRDLTWHPERCIPRKPCPGRCDALRELVAAKNRWIQSPPTPENGRTRWREIRRINEALQPWLSEQRQQLLDRKSEIATALRAEAVLASREYSFCLYPAQVLRDFFSSVGQISNLSHVSS